MEAVANGFRRQRAGYTFVALGTILLAFAFGRDSRNPDGLTDSRERKQLPALALRQLDGGMWRLADHRGQVAVINYWASWCSPCWEEAPVLMRLNREMGADGLAVVGIAMDEGSAEHVSESVRRFVQALQISYPIALPEPMSQMAYGMEGLPTTLLVDRNGGVAKTYVGALREADLRRDIRALMNETDR
jgi:cytochrome c biogenesis protein CcmG/thiol:disulfide interchange protein DsbE